MDIKKSNHKSVSKNIRFLSILLVLFILIPVLIRNITKDSAFKNLFKNNKTVTVGPTAPSVKTITLEVSEKNYQKLKTKRDNALGINTDVKNTGILVTSSDDLVKAKVKYEDQTHKAEIRLKGDWTEHLMGETWSFRVKMDGESTINGMRKFSLQHPKTRKYADEWLFHSLLKESDILHLRYDFVNVVLSIKGTSGQQTKELGLYAIEEFFDKRLIEHNRRREGIILKIDEDPLWQERRAYLSENINFNDIQFLQLASNENMSILPFGRKKIQEDSTLQKQFLTAKYLLEGFIQNKLSISEVFDVEKLAQFNAVCNILGVNHALIHHNYRFYYNPINSKIEPIGFDASGIEAVKYFYSYLNAKKDETYCAAYHAALERMISNDAYFNNILDYPGLKDIISLMQKAYPEYKFDKKALLNNRAVIRNSLFPVKSLNVFLQKADANTITLSIANFNKFHAEIDGLSNVDKKAFATPFQKTIIPPNTTQSITFKLDKNHHRLFINKKKKKAGFNLQKDLEDVLVRYKTLGTKKSLYQSILEWPTGNTHISETDIFRRRPNAQKYKFLVINDSTKIISCKPGNWKVGSHLYIPAGYTFKIFAGSSIELASPHAKIISFSPVQFIGTADAPIRIFAKATKGKGLLVLNARDTSILKHCHFDELSNCSTQGWAVSGSVNFYDAPVKLSNCSFTNNHSEDALNIINTYFEMDNIIFKNIQSDAFDGDFVNGTIKNSFFENIGNDAIDVSGSDIRVEDTQIINAGDKGLSAGENSRFVANRVIIKNSAIAVASKDQSTLKLSNSFLENNQLGFTAFKKKSEFGPANITADSLKLLNNKETSLIETGSSLLLNGKAVETVDQVVERMYGVEYGKKSN